MTAESRDIIFDSIEGCEVVKHEKEHTEKGWRFRWALILVGVILILMSFILFDHLQYEWKWGVFCWLFILGGILLLVADLCGPVKHPEQFTLRFSENISAASLLKITQQYDLKQVEDTPDLYIATKKQKEG